jgi:hypothetical protein
MGNKPRDLLVCSAVPQLNVPPLAPNCAEELFNIILDFASEVDILSHAVDKVPAFMELEVSAC